jgi:cytochrome P450
MSSTPQCPVVRIPWFDEDFQHDPYALLSELRERSPVVYDQELGYYLVLRYDDVEAMLLDRETFAAANASAPLFPPCPEALEILKAEGYKRVPTLNNADPPRHAPMRKAVFSCMSGRRLRSLEPEIRSFARRLIESLVKKPEFDFISELAHPLPAHAAFGLIGVPEEDHDRIKSWGDKRVLFTYGRLEPAEQIDVAKKVGLFWRYCEGFVAERDAERRDDFTSDLLTYRDENPDAVTIDDVTNIIYSMVLAGHESTTNALGSGFRHFLAARDQWQAVVDDPSLAENAVEECLRFDPPVLGHRRLAARDAEVAGVPIPEGSGLIMVFGSAHRDPRHFPEPDRFDVRREEARTHLTFGKGVHFCLGAPLARLEMRAVIELLCELAPGLQPTEGQALPYAGNALWRTLTELRLRP